MWLILTLPWCRLQIQNPPRVCVELLPYLYQENRFPENIEAPLFHAAALLCAMYHLKNRDYSMRALCESYLQLGHDFGLHSLVLLRLPQRLHGFGSGALALLLLLPAPALDLTQAPHVLLLVVPWLLLCSSQTDGTAPGLQPHHTAQHGGQISPPGKGAMGCKPFKHVSH